MSFNFKVNRIRSELHGTMTMAYAITVDPVATNMADDSACDELDKQIDIATVWDFNAIVDRVQGNRGEGVPMTDGDVLLIAEGVFRRCAEVCGAGVRTMADPELVLSAKQIGDERS